MDKDWQRGQAYVKAPKVTKELGVGKDGYQTGGVTIEATNPDETQTVTVRGTKAMRADKKPVKAGWKLRFPSYFLSVLGKEIRKKCFLFSYWFWREG